MSDCIIWFLFHLVSSLISSSSVIIIHSYSFNLYKNYHYHYNHHYNKYHNKYRQQRICAMLAILSISNPISLFTTNVDANTLVSLDSGELSKSQSISANIDQNASSSSKTSITNSHQNPKDQSTDYGLHHDEQILQTIDAISKGKYCTTAVSNAASIGTFSSSPSSSSVSYKNNKNTNIKSKKQHHQYQKRKHQHYHHHLLFEKDFANGTSSSSSSTPLIWFNRVENLRTIRSRFHHMQINLPLKHDKQAFFHRTLTDNEECRRVEKCIDLLAKILADYDPSGDRYLLLNQTIINAPLVEPNIYRLSIAWIQNDRMMRTSSLHLSPLSSYQLSNEIRLELLQCNQTITAEMFESSYHSNDKCQIYSLVEKITAASSWLSKKLFDVFREKRLFHVSKNDSTEWSNLFYDCHDHRWFITYHSLILQSIYDDGYGDQQQQQQNETDISDDIKYWFRVKGVISADIDVTETDINQCGRKPNKKSMAFVSEKSTSKTDALTHSTDDDGQQYEHRRTILNLLETHKCHNENSECIFLPGHGMFRGGYQCQCKVGFHSTVANLGPTFNGSLMERSYQDKHDGKNPAYDYMFTCERCQPGCDECQDNSPCLSSYNWAFRISLLTITVFCIIFVFIFALNIYRYRRLKVIKVASPIFLCITLLGCASMYLETVAIFPVMDTSTCVLTKWTRNFGFCLTYSSLLLKTWRVSLTYRVKSAHKIKLTDKQLLQWLFPILLVMAIYLAAWTISDTPQPFYIVDWNNLKFKQCDYNWWDHSLTIGEFFFLLWGIKVCYSVRNAESLFDEAKYITWAIYNITIVNMVMILIHLFILPDSGPDIKYFFGFLRTQLSTTTTVVLIFGPKFYRVIKGEGDLWNPRLQARGMMAETYAFNGIGLAHEETTDLYQENDDLKIEIQKLATQLEILKLSQMEFRNRHLSNHSKFSKIQHQQSQSD